MTQRITTTFHPAKKEEKKRFRRRSTRLILASLLLNLLALLLYAFPFAAAQLHKLRSTPAPGKKNSSPAPAAAKPAIFNAGHQPYFYAGHSFPADSATLLLNRDEHYSVLLSGMHPGEEERFKVTTVYHKVEKGETLYAIAKMYHVSVAAVKAINTIPTRGISTGNILKIMTSAVCAGYYGIDVSGWQNSIDWKAVHSDTLPSPLRFFIIKATQGKDITDLYFSRNWENARASGSLRGAYHFYIATEDPVLQADNYISHVRLGKGDLRPVIDLEYDCCSCDTLYISKEQYVKNLAVFISRIREHYGVEPILYTYRYFYDQYLKDHFDRYTYWMASYTKEAPRPMQLYGRPDSAFLPSIRMWQFSSSERIKGIVGNVDISFLPVDDLDAVLY